MAADTGRHRLHRVTGSVRFRVTVLATLAVIAVLAVGSLALVAGQRRLLRDDLEDRLRHRMRVAARRQQGVWTKVSGHATNICGHNRRVARERLERGKAEPLRERSLHEQIGAAEVVSQFTHWMRSRPAEHPPGTIPNP